ncbi:MAG TPA: hypothetical protein VFC23_01615 [Thermoanaerobaculia bacterium]|nr:hypothetical protein [Thermoanaerobaculia bacterium]
MTLEVLDQAAHNGETLMEPIGFLQKQLGVSQLVAFAAKVGKSEAPGAKGVRNGAADELVHGDSLQPEDWETALDGPPGGLIESAIGPDLQI